MRQWHINDGSSCDPRIAGRSVPQDAEVIVLLRDGTENEGWVNDFAWYWDSDGDSDIVFFRLKWSDE